MSDTYVARDRGKAGLIALGTLYVAALLAFAVWWQQPAWDQAQRAPEASASTPATEKPPPAPAVVAPKPAAPRVEPPPSGTPEPGTPELGKPPFGTSFAPWMAPAAAGLSTCCAIGLAVMAVRTRRLRRTWLELESVLHTWPSQLAQFNTRHDEAISKLCQDIAGVQRRLTDLETSFNRYKNAAAARTQAPLDIESEPRARTPAAAETADLSGAFFDAQSADPSAADSSFDAPAAVSSRAGDPRFFGAPPRRRNPGPAADRPSSPKAKLYARMPTPQGTFSDASVTSAADGWSLFEIEPGAGPLAKGTRARLGLYQAARVYAAALSSHKEYLMPVCEYEGPPLADHTAIKMVLPGELSFDGEQWLLTRKMKIKFIA